MHTFSPPDTIQKLKKARRFIEDHYSESLGLEEIAKSSHLSQFHFHRMFKSYFQVTCTDYLMRVRLEKSIQLLIYSNQSIADISFEVGFPNPETYIRNFKKHFQVTPNIYRKKNLNEPKEKNQLTELDTFKTKRIPNPFSAIKDLESFTLAILRTDGKENILRKTLHRLLDKTIPLGFLNREIIFFGRSLDPPNLTESKTQSWELGVKIPKLKVPKLPYPLEFVNWKRGRYLTLTHRGSAKDLESTYTKAYQYIIHSSIKIANEPCWEIYHKIPPFHQETEIEIYFRLKE